jgi:hypothetical protein
VSPPLAWPKPTSFKLVEEKRHRRCIDDQELAVMQERSTELPLIIRSSRLISIFYTIFRLGTLALGCFALWGVVFVLALVRQRLVLGGVGISLVAFGVFGTYGMGYTLFKPSVLTITDDGVSLFSRGRFCKWLWTDIETIRMQQNANGVQSSIILILKMGKKRASLPIFWKGWNTREIGKLLQARLSGHTSPVSP